MLAWFLNELVLFVMWALITGVFLFFFNVQITRRRK
jgi:hypothetical protein